MRIETDVYATGEAHVDHDGEIQIEDILVNGEKPSEKMRELAYEVLLEQNDEWVRQNEPSDEDTKSAIGEARFDEYYQSEKYRRIA